MNTTFTELKNRWLLGSDAPPKIDDFPEALRDALKEMPSESLSLNALALTSHYQALAEQPQAPEELHSAPQLPSISLPLLAEHSRTHNALALNIIKEDNRFATRLTASVLQLLARRGYAIAPRDYFTYVAHDSHVAAELPLYLPWQHYWQQHVQKGEVLDYAIDADNWVDYTPAPRLLALEMMRNRDPNACRELIAECIGQEPAEVRINILSVLQEKLSAEDAPFLRSLLKDRSQKLVNRAKQLLMQLGEFECAYNDDGENSEISNEINPDLELLIKGFEVSEVETITGKKAKPNTHPLFTSCAEHLPATRKQVRLINYREQKKRQKRRALLERFSLPVLAEALSLSLEQLIDGWAFNAHRVDDNAVFIDKLRHLPDEYMPLVAMTLANFTPDYPSDIEPIWSRFSADSQMRLALAYWNNEDLEWGFSMLLTLPALFDDEQSPLDWQTLQTTRAWKKLATPKKSKKAPSYSDIEDECLALGLFLSPAVAKQALDYLLAHLSAQDFGQHDFAFFALRLNAGLG